MPGEGCQRTFAGNPFLRHPVVNFVAAIPGIHIGRSRWQEAVGRVSATTICVHDPLWQADPAEVDTFHELFSCVIQNPTSDAGRLANSNDLLHVPNLVSKFTISMAVTAAS